MGVITDISHHQNDAGPVDWNAVRRAVDASYIKTTEGTDYTDPKWRLNHDSLYSEARGAYHFCGASRTRRYLDPVAEANNFANRYLEVGWEMRPAYDIEMAGASPDWLRRFRDQFRKRTGVERDRVYTSWSLIRTALRPELWMDGYNTDLWIARYNSFLGFNHPRLVLWQNSENSVVPGFRGGVDTNIPQNGWTPAHDIHGQEAIDMEVGMFPYKLERGKGYHRDTITIESDGVSTLVQDVFVSLASGFDGLSNVKIYFPGGGEPAAGSDDRFIEDLPQDTREWWKVPRGCFAFSIEYECKSDGSVPSLSFVYSGKQ